MGLTAEYTIQSVALVQGAGATNQVPGLKVQETQKKETDEPLGQARSSPTARRDGSVKIGGLLFLSGSYVVIGIRGPVENAICEVDW